MFNKFVNSKLLNPILPILAMVSYIVIMSAFGLLFKSRIAIGALLGDLVTILLFGWLYYKSDLRQPTRPLFKPQTWFYVLAIGFFGLAWMMSQTAAKVLYEAGFKFNMHSYQDAVKNDASIYILTSVFIAPIAEELVFRAFGYCVWRKYIRHFVAAIATSILFAIMHMTFVHIPIAITVGLLSAILFEMTGHIRYGILMHFLYNLFSAGIAFGLPEKSIWLNPFLTILYMFLLITVLCIMIEKAKAVRKFAEEPKLIDKLNQKP